MGSLCSILSTLNRFVAIYFKSLVVSYEELHMAGEQHSTMSREKC